MGEHIKDWSLTLLIIGVISIVGNWIGYEVMPFKAIPGMAVLVLICLAGLIVDKLLAFKSIPSIAYIGIIGLIVTLPWFPGSAKLVEWTSDIELLALTTPILAYAGISIGNSWESFVKIGWKAIIVGMFVLLGTYLGSAIVAEIILKMQGII